MKRYTRLIEVRRPFGSGQPDSNIFHYPKSKIIGEHWDDASSAVKDGKYLKLSDTELDRIIKMINVDSTNSARLIENWKTQTSGETRGMNIASNGVGRDIYPLFVTYGNFIFPNGFFGIEGYTLNTREPHLKTLEKHIQLVDK